jgi:TetR/AcrR family transcriptional repressor of multidrug resistance operon
MKPKDEKKVEAIAAAVYQLAARHGLSAVTLAEIARTAGVATSTLYVYYKSREDLLDDVYQKAKTATVMRYGQNDDPQAGLKARVRRIWNNMVDNRIANQAQVAFLEQYYHSELLSQTSRELVERMIAPFIELIVAGQKSEQLKPVPPPLLAAAVMSLARETAILIGSGDLPDNEKTRLGAFQLCWDAIKA